MNKVLATADEAVAVIPDGAVIMMGGFGLCGIPEHLIAALHRRGTKNLTIVSNNAGIDDYGVGPLLRARQVRKMIATYVGENKEFERQFLQKEIEVELVPQGTFSERMRAAGAGIGGFFTPTGAGTLIAEGKESRVINGRTYILEAPLHADFAFVKAWKGDTEGNPDHVVTPGIYVQHLLQGGHYEKRIEKRTTRSTSLKSQVSRLTAQRRRFVSLEP